MSKYIFLKFKELSHWKSCQLILDELESTYKLTFKDITIVEISLDDKSWETSISTISALHPEYIIFADHRFRVPLWIHLIREKFKSDLKWIVHVYGCFTGRVDEWMQLTQIASHEKIKILTGSEPHTKIVKSFFSTQGIVETFTFPFGNNKYSFNQILRNNFREKYQIQESEIVLCYAGRISFQKNVHHLVKLCRDFRVRLFVAGGVDDKNPREIPHGYYLNHAGALFFDELDRSKDFVTYLSYLNSEELNELYQGSDYAISLSTLYGEDYGLSLVESLSSGLGVIATSWGGHKDLASLPQTQLIDVVLENKTLKLDFESFSQILSQLIIQDRKLNILKFKEKYSRELASEKLQGLLKDFSTLGNISKAAVMFSLIENKPWKDQEFFNLHEKILQPYWS